MSIRPDESFTLLDAEHEYGQIVWQGTKNEKQTRSRWIQGMDLLGRDTPVAKVRKRQLDALVKTLRATPTDRKRGAYAPGTINRVLSAVSAMLRHCMEAEIIDSLPVIPWQRQEEGRIAWLREEDVARFISHIRAQPVPPLRRVVASNRRFVRKQPDDIALVAQVLLVTGLRVNEILSLSVDAVSPDTISIHPEHSKTSKARNVPLPPALARPLRDLIERGMPPYSHVYRAMSYASRDLGLPDVVTPHVLRHTTASLLTKRGVPSLTVARVLGHSSLATTRKYDHFSPATNPLADLVSYEVAVPACAPTTVHLDEQPTRSDTPGLPPEPPVPPGRNTRTNRYLGAGGLGGNRTPVQGFAEAPRTSDSLRNPLKSRGKPRDLPDT